jgi:4-amino-4-deoxy-L-arabinose transferase-like glycosyltransferase
VQSYFLKSFAEDAAVADKTPKHADFIIGVAIAVVWLAMVILVNPIGDFPLNDDWIYGGATKLLVEHGDFRIPGWVAANALTQAFLGALFCLPIQFSYTALRLSTLTLGFVGVLALYACVREIGGSVRTALLASATLAVNPLYFELSNTFMTDVPFTSIGIVAIYFFARGFKRQSQLSLAFGVLASLAALLDRQAGIVLLLGFAVAYPIRFGWNLTAILRGLIPLALGLALHIAYQRWLTSTGRAPELWYSTVHDLRPKSVLSFLATSLKLAARSAPYVGLFTLPLTVFVTARTLAEGRGFKDKVIRTSCGGLAIALFCFLWWQGRVLPQMGNVLIESGLGPLTLADNLKMNEPPMSDATKMGWLAVTALGCFSVYQILCIAISSTKRFVGQRKSGIPAAWLHAFFTVVLASYWFLLSLLANSSGAAFDRYLLFIVPTLGIWMILSTSVSGAPIRSQADYGRLRRAAVIAVVVIIAFGGFSVAGTHDYLAWNRARWTAIDYLMDEGHVQPEKIDGGYEFNGRFLYNPEYKQSATKSWWWVVDDEYVIAFGNMTGYQRIRDYHYSQWLHSQWLPPYRRSVVVLHKAVRTD